MITKIPEGQMCQSFDPRMHRSKEELRTHGAVVEQPNVSCLAPAYVYIDGKHGKKFLCDFHYFYEITLTKDGYSESNNSWKEIQQFIIDERERVKDTFAKNVTTTKTLGHKCSLVNYFNQDEQGCTADALVIVKPIKRIEGKVNYTHFTHGVPDTADIFYCNFHFIRTYYRYLSNGIVYEDYHNFIDERYRMTMTIAEETERLTYI